MTPREALDPLVPDRREDATNPFTVSTRGLRVRLTRNGHGAGFWDRGLGALGERLTRAAKSHGSVDLYVNDDGKVDA